MKYKSIWFLFFLILLLPLPSLSASFTVDSLTDETDTSLDGVCAAASGCTLRAAIQEANALGGTTTITFGINGTITLAVATTNEDVAADGDLDITRNVILQGNGVESTVIAGDGSDRIFHVISSAGSLALTDLRLTGGGSDTLDFGGGTYTNGGSVTLTNVKIDSCTSHQNGGAIYSDGGALSLVNSTLSDNVSNAGGGVFATGGTLSMSGSTVSGNEAREGGAGLVLYLLTGTVFISNSTITSNIGYTMVGGIGGVGTTVVMDKSTVSNNYGSLAAGIGSYYGNWTITNSTVSGNVAVVDPSGTVDCLDGSVNIDHIGTAGCIGGQGAGISDLLVGQSTYVITNSTIAGNSAGDYGGGFLLLSDSSLTLNNVTLANNAATNTGGGIYSSNAVVTARNSLLAQNTANASPDCYGAVTLGHYNLLGDQSGCTPSSDGTDIVGNAATDVGIIDPKLRDLADNGGTTQTVGLYSTSPALDKGNSTTDGCTDGSGTLTKDQRDLTRPVDGNSDGQVVCDIGAYEYDPNSAVDQVAEAAVTEEAPAVDESATITSQVVTTTNGIISGGAVAGLFGCTLSTTREPNHSPLGLIFILGNVMLFCVLRRRVKACARVHTRARSKW